MYYRDNGFARAQARYESRGPLICRCAECRVDVDSLLTHSITDSEDNIYCADCAENLGLVEDGDEIMD